MFTVIMLIVGIVILICGCKVLSKPTSNFATGFASGFFGTSIIIVAMLIILSVTGV